jgi:hypothetical protein
MSDHVEIRLMLNTQPAVLAIERLRRKIEAAYLELTGVNPSPAPAAATVGELPRTVEAKAHALHYSNPAAQYVRVDQWRRGAWQPIEAKLVNPAKGLARAPLSDAHGFLVGPFRVSWIGPTDGTPRRAFIAWAEEQARAGAVVDGASTIVTSPRAS